jgi:endonuclease/exonuclease/phosphatase family metal-dependent hydrolase
MKKRAKSTKQIQTADPIQYGDFSVMTLNLRFGLADDGPHAWKFRRKILPELFDNYPSDFIGFQEVNGFQSDDLTAILGDYRSIGRRDPAPRFWQNNVIFYQRDWELTQYQHFYLSPTPDIPSRSRKSRWPRQCTIGIFQKNDRHLMCINTHFDFNPSVQAQSARYIMDRLLYFPKRTPAVLMGDFNAPPESHHFKIFTGRDRKGEKTRNPLFECALKKPYGGTHHGFSGTSDGDCIDWILFTAEKITRVDCRIIQDQVDGTFYSDHFPVVAIFRWRDRHPEV